MSEKPPQELTTKELLIKLKENKTLKCLVNKGIVPLKVNYYLEISNLYDIQMIVNKPLNDCVMQSLTDVAMNFNCHENTVRNALNFINE